MVPWIANPNPLAQLMMKVVCVIVNLHMTSPITIIDQLIEQNCINSSTITTYHHTTREYRSTALCNMMLWL